jgi:hypothetical protein
MIQKLAGVVFGALMLVSLAGVSVLTPTVAVSDNNQPEAYTGILINARSLPDITRSMNPVIYGPAPGSDLIYPDRSHVPNPDQCQDESTARYYRTVADAEAGVGGPNPMIVEAMSVVGYAKDSLTVTADDEQRMQNLDKQLHYSQTWKLGILVPANQ